MPLLTLAFLLCCLLPLLAHAQPPPRDPPPPRLNQAQLSMVGLSHEIVVAKVTDVLTEHPAVIQMTLLVMRTLKGDTEDRTPTLTWRVGTAPALQRGDVRLFFLCQGSEGLSTVNFAAGVQPEEQADFFAKLIPTYPLEANWEIPPLCLSYEHAQPYTYRVKNLGARTCWVKPEAIEVCNANGAMSQFLTPMNAQTLILTAGWQDKGGLFATCPGPSPWSNPAARMPPTLPVKLRIRLNVTTTQSPDDPLLTADDTQISYEVATPWMDTQAVMQEFLRDTEMAQLAQATALAQRRSFYPEIGLLPLQTMNMETMTAEVLAQPFKNAHFWSVGTALPMSDHPAPTFFCVTQAGEVISPFQPEQFAAILAHEDVTGWTDEQFLQAAKVYVHLTNQLNEFEWKLITGPGDGPPGLFGGNLYLTDEQKAAFEKAVAAATPPAVTRDGQRVTVTLWTYQYFGADRYEPQLRQWTITLAPEFKAEGVMRWGRN